MIPSEHGEEHGEGGMAQRGLVPPCINEARHRGLRTGCTRCSRGVHRELPREGCTESSLERGTQRAPSVVEHKPLVRFACAMPVPVLCTCSVPPQPVPPQRVPPQPAPYCVVCRATNSTVQGSGGRSHTPSTPSETQQRLREKLNKYKENKYSEKYKLKL